MEQEKKIEEPTKKPKRILSEKQKEALARGRQKAHERLRQFRKSKGSVEKSDEPIEEVEKVKPKKEPKKKITKEEVNYGDEEDKQEFVEVHNKIVEEEEQEEKLQLKHSPKVVKRKKKPKQVVIVEERSSSSESEEEQVIVRRSRRKSKPVQQSPPQQNNINIPKKPSILFY